MNHPTKRKRILITGGSGFLGWHLVKALCREHDVAFTYSSLRISILGCQGYCLDLDRPFTIENCLRQFDPDVVVHAAALANTGECQQYPERAHAVNVRGTERLIRRLRHPRTLFVYISTDLVFDGEHQPYGEKDETHPVSHYGKSKLDAETIVRKMWPNHVILRTPLMYGAANPFGRGSFLQWLDGALRRREDLNLFADEYRTPAYVGDVARSVRALLHHDGQYRTYHVGGPERISRVDFGMRLAGIRGYDTGCIHKTYLAGTELAKQRARDVSLNSTRIQNTFLLRWTPIDDALRAIFYLDK